MKNATIENSILSKITFVTSVGDFVSLFAIMKLVHQASGKVSLSAYLVAIRSLSVAVGGLAFPTLVRFMGPKKLIVGTQLISCLILAGIAVSVSHLSNDLILYFYLATFLLSFLKQIFESARETHSKIISEGAQVSHRVVQAQLLHGLYSAQVIGPIVSFLIVRSLPISVPIFIDSVSFLLAGLVAMSLSASPQVLQEKISVIRPLRYLREFPALRKIFLLRSIGYWVPVGIFNYALFGVVTDHYGLALENSAWVYAAIGLGSVVASTLLKSAMPYFSSTSDGVLAFAALMGLGLTRLGFVYLPSFAVAMVVLAIGGVFNGLNAIATQSLRRKLSTTSQFPEIVGLELVVGKTADFLVQSFVLSVVASGALGFQGFVLVSAISLFVLSALHLDRDLRI